MLHPPSRSRFTGQLSLLACLAALLPACAQVAPQSGAAANATPESLQGSAWQMQVAEGAPIPQVQFVNPERVTGTTGCNTFNGPLAVVSGGVKLGPLASTKRMCLGEPHETEKRFLAALKETRTLQRLNNQLQLLDGQGRVLLILNSAEMK